MNKPPLAEILVRQFDADVGEAMQYMAEHDCEWEVALVRSCPNLMPSDIAYQLLTPTTWAEYYRAASAASAEYKRAWSAARAEFDHAVWVASAEYKRAWSAARAEFDHAVWVASAEYYHRCAEIFVRLCHEQTTTS